MRRSYRGAAPARPPRWTAWRSNLCGNRAVADPESRDEGTLGVAAVRAAVFDERNREFTKANDAEAEQVDNDCAEMGKAILAVGLASFGRPCRILAATTPPASLASVAGLTEATVSRRSWLRPPLPRPRLLPESRVPEGNAASFMVVPRNETAHAGVRRIGEVVGDRAVIRDLDRASERDCLPRLGKESLDVRVLNLLGYDDSSPCGASRDAAHLPLTCFNPGTQDRACAKHDHALRDCKSPFSELRNHCVLGAHRDLANESPDPTIRHTFRFMQWLSPHGLSHPTEVEEYYRTMLPIYEE